jgi:hypothetical protein
MRICLMVILRHVVRDPELIFNILANVSPTPPRDLERYAEALLEVVPNDHDDEVHSHMDNTAFNTTSTYSTRVWDLGEDVVRM